MFSARDYMLVTAFKNSIILTVVSVAVLVVLCCHGRLRHPAPARHGWPTLANLLVLAGLIIPPAIVPTI